MRKDRELLDLVRKVFGNKLAPSLKEVDGEWYLFEQEGRVPKILLDEGSAFFIDEPYTRDRIAELGWKATPILVYKVEIDE